MYRRESIRRGSVDFNKARLMIARLMLSGAELFDLDVSAGLYKDEIDANDFQRALSLPDLDALIKQVRYSIPLLPLV